MNLTIFYAAIGTGFTFLMTCLGAAFVFFFQKDVSERFHVLSLGFAAGVMAAAGIWSLMIPAMERAEQTERIGWLVAGLGLFLGMVFFHASDILLERGVETEKPGCAKRVAVFVAAVTLHNIPEGMAVGMAFVPVGCENESAHLAIASALALGIGVQNLPEGAAISLPLRRSGKSPGKAFAVGVASGIVEPTFGIAAAFFAGSLAAVIPWMMAFAAGAMAYVVVRELLPEIKESPQKKAGWRGLFAGFLLMMLLDILLG